MRNAIMMVVGITFIIFFVIIGSLLYQRNELKKEQLSFEMKKNKYDRFEIIPIGKDIWRYDRHTGESYFYSPSKGTWINVPESTYTSVKISLENLTDSAVADESLKAKSPFYDEGEKTLARSEIKRLLDTLQRPPEGVSPKAP